MFSCNVCVSSFTVHFDCDEVLFPAPAIGMRATKDNNEILNKNNDSQEQPTLSPPRNRNIDTQRDNSLQHTAGTLPDSANGLSTAARGLLIRLLDRDPRVRLRNLRQLQQSAFYMGFNFEHVKAKKVSPKSILDQYFPGGKPASATSELEAFATFDQPTFV